MRLELVPIEHDGTPRGFSGELAEEAHDGLEATVGFYRAMGFERPWISYLGVADGAAVGICSFKSRPIDGRVEIGYFTFPQHEGRGVATAMAAELIAIAAACDPSVLVTAQTLCERNASHRVLEKLGFSAVGTVDHPQDGTVLEWHHTLEVTHAKKRIGGLER
ncbi:MAG TPA: GNAT family protein [Gammaproteobacteria bacterium]